jgi:hypothetical protein
MDKTELETYLDTHFAKVIENAKTLATDMHSVEFAGTTSGLLIKTGIKLAVDHGAPRQVLSGAVQAMLGELYGT